eukprot:11227364-Lingulodinium_polyedra.AAC.1
MQAHQLSHKQEQQRLPLGDLKAFRKSPQNILQARKGTYRDTLAHTVTHHGISRLRNAAGFLFNDYVRHWPLT